MKKTKLATGMCLSSVTVSDLKKAKHLFVDLLGFEVKEYAEEYNWMELQGEEGSRLGIGQYAPQSSPDKELKPGTNAIPSISVLNIEEAKKHLESNGVQFLGKIMEIPGEVKLALFKDFDGNKYFLAQCLKD